MFSFRKCFTDGPEFRVDEEVWSDHLPIILELKLENINYNAKNTLLAKLP